MKNSRKELWRLSTAAVWTRSCAFFFKETSTILLPLVSECQGICFDPTAKDSFDVSDPQMIRYAPVVINVPYHEVGVAPFRECSLDTSESKGCGTAMRTAPVGLYFHGDLERLREVARASSLITHGHPCALAGGVATAYLVSLALRPAPVDELTAEGRDAH